MFTHLHTFQMFEMDAYVGVDVLGLVFMKGEQPHAGFPEVWGVNTP